MRLGKWPVGYTVGLLAAWRHRLINKSYGPSLSFSPFRTETQAGWCVSVCVCHIGRQSLESMGEIDETTVQYKRSNVKKLSVTKSRVIHEVCRPKLCIFLFCYLIQPKWHAFFVFFLCLTSAEAGIRHVYYRSSCRSKQKPELIIRPIIFSLQTSLSLHIVYVCRVQESCWQSINGNPIYVLVNRCQQMNF